MTEFEKTRLRQLRQDLADEIIACIQLEMSEDRVTALQMVQGMLDAALADIALAPGIEPPSGIQKRDEIRYHFND